MNTSEDRVLSSGITMVEARKLLKQQLQDESQSQKPSPKSLTLKELEELGISTEPSLVISNRPKPNSKK